MWLTWIINETSTNNLAIQLRDPYAFNQHTIT